MYESKHKYISTEINFDVCISKSLGYYNYRRRNWTRLPEFKILNKAVYILYKDNILDEDINASIPHLGTLLDRLSSLAFVCLPV